MAKEKSIKEMRDEIQEIHTRASGITEKAKGESRRLSTEEERQVNEAMLEITQLRLDIANREAENAATQSRQHIVPGKEFSLRKAMFEMVEGVGYSEEVRAANEAGRELMGKSGISIRGAQGLLIPVEARANFTATGTAATGSSLIETQFLDIMPSLKDRLVLAQAGASVMSGLVGNIDIPDYSGSTAAWESENAAAKDGGGTFAHKTMRPKRLTTLINVSRQLLIQDSLSVENILRTELISAISSKLEATILGGHAHAETMPDGLFTGFAGASKDMTWDSIVDLETEADLSNALTGNTGYIMHTSLRGKAKKTAKNAANTGYLLDPDGTINGYKALRTNAVATDGKTPLGYGIIFGNWADLIIAQWGGLEFMVDQYTGADKALVRIIVNSYWDAIPRRSVSFNKAFLK